MALFVLSLCPFDISVGEGAFVIGLGQISSFLSQSYMHELRGADLDSYICVTKFNSVSQMSILYNNIEFCVTKFNSVEQESILCHKNQFCLTEFNSVSQIQLCVTKGWDMRISNKIEKLNCWVDKNEFVHDWIEFCYTELSFVSRNWIL